jgi:hypothetical protein
MLDQVTAPLRKFLGKASQDHVYMLRFVSRLTAAIPCRPLNPSNRRSNLPKPWVQITT